MKIYWDKSQSIACDIEGDEMIKYLKKSLAGVVLAVMFFSTLACNHVLNNAEVSNTDTKDNTDDTKILVINNLEKTTENETTNVKESSYNKTKTLEENVDILNNMLETKYGRRLKVSGEEDYETAGRADWTLILKDSKVGIDTSTWKFNYDSDSDDSKYMDAILTTFTFFCGDEMGNSLWQLTGDLLDGGADETLYGFVHSGSQVTYKNGKVAAYESGNSQSTIYIWLTPS
jgi:hypothetical protein